MRNVFLNFLVTSVFISSLAQSSKYETDEKGIRRQDKLAIEEALSKWDNGINEGDEMAIKSLYADKVLYFGSQKTREECVADKLKMSQIPELVHSLSGEVTYTKINDDCILANFVRRFGSANKSIQNYGTYMLFERINGAWKVVVESDVIKDKELLAQHKNASLYYLDPAVSTLTGIYKKQTQTYNSKSGKQSEIEVHILELEQPIQVLPMTTSGRVADSASKQFDLVASQVNKIELMISDPKPFDNKEGKTVTVRGKLALPSTKNYFTKVILNEVTIVK
ncbi:MAG: hypothetical protein NZ519_06185 [Bacteroidia bacterium]|nr:hypothetical protein [Bacteroidia bacterium]MDW8302003.1 hypothetical protein [Bacteroidia bacterium]